MLRLIVDENYSNVKPIGFLKKKLNLSFNAIKYLIDKKKILVNNSVIFNDTILKKNDVIDVLDDNVVLKEVIKNKKKPINFKIEEIYEDANILVLNKPPFLAVQGDGKNETVLNHLSYLRQKKNLNFLEPIHRIDKNTSGVLIIAKNIVTQRMLHKKLKDGDFEKVYVCLVIGRPKKKTDNIKLFLKVRDNKKEKVVVCDSSFKNSISSPMDISV